MINDGVHIFSINVTVETFVAVNKVWVYLKINVPAENESDKSYQKQLLRTVVDVEKNAEGNFWLKRFEKSFVKSSGVEIKFPMKKVCESFSSVTILKS